MKNITLLGSLLAVLSLIFSACTKYDPIYGVADTKNTEQLQLKKDLVYIHDNDIYMVNEILADEKRLTYTPSVSKTQIAFSPKHDKVAYLNSNGTPVIIDTTGAQLEILVNYTNVTDLKWHANNGNPTLYMLVNNSIIFHGPTLSIPSQPFSYFFPSDANSIVIDAVEIDNSLNIAFSYRFQRPYSPTSSWNKYYHGVGFNYNSASNTDTWYYIEDGYYSPFSTTYSSISYPYYHDVRINTPNQTVILGQISNGYESSYTSYSLREYYYTSSAVYSLSTTISYSNLYQETSKGYTAANPYQIRKYLNVLPAGVPPPTGATNTFTINFTNQNNTPPTYFDWKP